MKLTFTIESRKRPFDDLLTAASLQRRVETAQPRRNLTPIPSMPARSPLNARPIDDILNDADVSALLYDPSEESSDADTEPNSDHDCGSDTDPQMPALVEIPRPVRPA